MISEFIALDGRGDGRGPLSPRTRFMLYLALRNISADLEWSLNVDESYSRVRDDMPLSVRELPRPWWQQMRRSALRLLEAARTGVLGDLVPRTPAEEVLLALATREDYIAEAQGTLIDDFAPFLNSLPVDEAADGEYEEILPWLTGDEDVLMLWDAGLDGLEHPAESVNIQVGLGDYRPEAWHHYFDSRRP